MYDSIIISLISIQDYLSVVRQIKLFLLDQDVLNYIIYMTIRFLKKCIILIALVGDCIFFVFCDCKSSKILETSILSNL